MQRLLWRTEIMQHSVEQLKKYHAAMAVLDDWEAFTKEFHGFTQLKCMVEADMKAKEMCETEKFAVIDLGEIKFHWTENLYCDDCGERLVKSGRVQVRKYARNANHILCLHCAGKRGVLV